MYRSLLALGLAAAVAPAASADVIVTRLDGQDLGLNATISTNYGSNAYSVDAGLYEWTTRPGTTLPGLSSSFSTVCVDLSQYISTGSTYTYQATAVADMPTVGAAPSLTGLRVGLLTDLFSKYWDKANDSDKNAAAFQLAVWEIVYEDLSKPAAGLDTDTGKFRANVAGSTADDLADTWLKSLNGSNPGSLGGLSFVGLVSGTNQDQLTVYKPSVTPPTPTPVPAPAGVVLAAVALGAVGLRRTRTRLLG